MKIAVVVNELNIRGGTHKQVLRLCEYLRERNIEFEIYTKYFIPELTYKEFENFDIVYLKKEVTKFYDSKRNLFKKICNRKIERAEERQLYGLISKDVDIINVHDNGLPYLIQLAKKNGKRIVWQINDLPDCYGVGVSKRKKEKFTIKLRKNFYIRLAQKVDCITVNVTKNKERVQECMKRDAKVLHCGVDINEELLLHKFPGDVKKFRLLSTGVFFPYRNYETLINVVEKMKETKIPVYLDIIGSTKPGKEYADKIKNMIAEKDLDDYVTIWGQVNEDKFNELYNAANAFAFINIDQSWGLAVFEAMSCGLPVVVSESVGAVELLHDQEDAIILNPLDVNKICDVLKRLMEDRKYYENISAKAMKIVKDYSWDQLYSSKMLDIFCKL